jgi:hypothetical protein
MMDHPKEQSNLEDKDESSETNEKPRSYYYDDATNYETYRDDEDDDNHESTPSENPGD